MEPTLHVVHCIDTEGPLEETLDSTFERIFEKWGINIKSSRENLVKIQNKEIDLNGLENKIADFISPKRLAYLDSWEKIEEMVCSISSDAFRNSYSDPHNNPNAKKFDNLEYIDAINLRLKIMDGTALSLCMENDLPIVVFDLFKPGNLTKVLSGTKIGTTISNSKTKNI